MREENVKKAVKKAVEKTEEEERDKIKLKNLAVPAGVWLSGVIVCAIAAPMTTNVNGGVGLGFLLMVIGSIMILVALYEEFHRIGKGTPFPLNRIFPSYHIVPDSDETTKRLTEFRNSFGAFLSKPKIEENSSMQDYATQILWHSLALWKRRMDKLGVTLRFESSRRSYTSNKTAVRTDDYFDGRYDVNDVYEEIDATRIFYSKGRSIEKLRDKEVAHYALLSVKETVDGNVVCPNCGSPTTRSNLMDGCDYCDTKFTVEDVSNRVGSFGLRHDFAVSESKREAVTALIYPWVFMISMMPFIYFGIIGGFIYMPGYSIFAKLFTGIFAAGLLGLFGWCMVKLNMIIWVPLVLVFGASWKSINKKMIYRSAESQEQEKKMAETVRSQDPLFSIQSFFGGVQNKLMAIHFADQRKEINAFSEQDLSACLDAYQRVIDVDTTSLTLESYEIAEGMQCAWVDAELLLRELDYNDKIKTRSENVKMRLVKSAACKTQAVCAPSVLKCNGCGSSLSLMEGKFCAYCGSSLDMKKYDWVIMDYRPTIS